MASVEFEPNGKDHRKGGGKLDGGKLKPRLIISSMARALTQVSEVGTYGAIKYCDDGWVDVPEGVTRYTDAMLRHFLAEGRGEERDAETGILHAAHTAWCALVRLELMLRESEK